MREIRQKNNDELWFTENRRTLFENSLPLDLSLETFTTLSRLSDEVSLFKDNKNLIRIVI